MINHEFSSMFWDDSVHKDLVIVTDDGHTEITNTELHQEQFELTEAISNTEKLVFGSCVASSVKFTASNVFEDLNGKWITVTNYLAYNDEYPLKIGRFKVNSDIPTADRKKREIVAYDVLYDIMNTNVADWYNYLLPKNTDTVTLELFRNSFFSYFGVEQEPVSLPNDKMIVEKTIEPEQLSGKDVINAICEINGCFGHIGRDGKFKYVFLEPMNLGIYPSVDLYPSESLYPVEPSGTSISQARYIPPVTYENYITKPITGVQIKQEEGDVGATAGGTSNAYVIQDNFLVYGKDADQLLTIANNILSVIKDIVFRPFKAKAKGNPCIEVGDAIRLNTKTVAIESYVLSRTLKGIQSLRDSFQTRGKEKQGTEVNSVARSIIQLKNKTNVLTRTVDQTKSELSDLKEQTSTSFTQTAERITSVALDVDTLKDVTTEHTSKIEQSAKSISMSVTNGTATSGIEITLTKLDGSEETVRGTINMTGMVTFRALETEGSTQIHGGNIITGTITAEQIDISNHAFIGTVVADGGDFSRGELSSKSLYVENSIQMGSSGDISAYEITANGTLKCGYLAVERSSGYYDYAEWQTVVVMDSNGNPLQINFLGTLDVG